MIARLRHAGRTAWQWFVDGKVGWLGAIFLLILIAGPHVFHWGSLEPRIRWQGTIIELSGIICVAIGLGNLRQEFRLPSVWSELTGYLWRAVAIFQKKRPNNVIISPGTGTAVGIGMAVAYAEVTGTVEERITRLEARMKDFRGEFDKEKASVAEQIRIANAKTEEEIKARRAGDEAAAKALERTMTGDTALEVVGLIYVCFGLVISNTSQEMASLVPNLL